MTETYEPRWRALPLPPCSLCCSWLPSAATRARGPPPAAVARRAPACAHSLQATAPSCRALNFRPRNCFPLALVTRRLACPSSSEFRHGGARLLHESLNTATRWAAAAQQHAGRVYSRAAATEMAVVSAAAPEWATKEPCLMGIDEAGRGPVLGPMVYGCMYCARSYHGTLATLSFADSKTLKEEQREELFESLKKNSSIGWEVDVICPKVLSAKMLKRTKVNLNEISHNSAMGLVKKALDMGVLLAEVYVDTVGDPEKYRVKLAEKFPGIKFVVAKKADSIYPVVSGASIVAKVTRDRAVRNWAFEETAQNMHMNTGSGYPGDPNTIQWLKDHKHPVFGFPTLVRFSWGTCTPYFKNGVEVTWESDEVDEDAASNGSAKRQVKLSSLGFTGFKRKSEEIESSGKARCKFFQARKLELVRKFQ